MNMATKPTTRSERAIDLLKRLVLHTEPGGEFYWENQPSSAAREEFMAEVCGVVTGNEDPGEAAPESQVALAKLALRTIRGILTDQKMSVQQSFINAGVMCDAALHVLGVPRDEAERRPTVAEMQTLMPVPGAVCNCPGCRERRANEARKKRT